MDRTDLAWFAYSGGYLAVSLIFLFIAKLLFDLVTPYCLKKELTEKDNPAFGVHLAGYLAGLLAIICSVFAGEAVAPSLEQFASEMIDVAIYGGLGIALLCISGILNDKFVMGRFKCREEIIDRQNTAVASVSGAAYLGSGLLIAASIYASRDLVSVLIFFVLGQLVLIVFCSLYKAVTKYDDLEELGEKKNLSAGVAFAGNLIAYSVILFKGIGVDPISSVEFTLQDRLLNFGYYAIGGVFLLAVGRIIADKLFLPSVSLHKEIVEDRNLNAGIVEGTLVLSIGLVLFFCL